MYIRYLIFNNYNICCYFFTDPNLWNAIQARFDDSVDSTISDVSGGSNYKLLSSPGGFLSEKNPANISLLMNTDGVAIFRSSSTMTVLILPFLMFLAVATTNCFHLQEDSFPRKTQRTSPC